MTEEWKDITISVPRKTFITGTVLLKCKSNRFPCSYDGHNQEAYLIQKVLEGSITIDKSCSELNENRQKHQRKHKRSKIACNIILPDQILCNVQGLDQTFQIRLLEPRFTRKPKIYHVVVENSKSYATYEGEVIGYLYDTVKEVKRVKIIPPSFELIIENSGIESEVVTIDGIEHETPYRKSIQKGTYLLGINQLEYTIDRDRWQFNQWSDGETKTVRLLSVNGDRKLKPIYERVVEKQKSIAPPEQTQSTGGPNFSFAGCFSNILVALVYIWFGSMLVGLIASLGITSLYVLGAILALYLIIRFGSPIMTAIQGLVRIVLWGFFALFAISIVFTLVSDISESSMDIVDHAEEKVSYVPVIEESVEAISDNVPLLDTFIVQKRIWSDYHGREYSTELKFKKSSVKAAESFRISLPQASTMTQYSQMYSGLIQSGESANSFKYIYQNLDSIRVNRQLNRSEFAEMVICLVQDIQYVLILTRACDQNQYADLFVKEYLSQGKPCADYVKHGLYAPEEFLSNLQGDCDTRTVTLFKILSHYNYDVRIYNSEKLGHSILGLNLGSLDGTKFVSNGKPYLICETTVYGSPPGGYNPYAKDQNMWETALYNHYD